MKIEVVALVHVSFDYHRFEQHVGICLPEDLPQLIEEHSETVPECNKQRILNLPVLDAEESFAERTRINERVHFVAYRETLELPL